MTRLPRPTDSWRMGPHTGFIGVCFDNDIATEISCPSALIGNPIARLIAEAAAWRTRPTPPYVLRDCPAEYEADLRELLASMPEADRYLSIEPGWYGLVAQAWREAKAIDPGVRCVEVKQKWGELRVYLRDRDFRLSGQFGEIELRALRASERTCEWCAGQTEAEPSYGHPSRLCIACRDFSTRWHAAWREAER